MEVTVENLALLIMALTAVVLVGVLLASNLFTSTQSLGKDIEIRVLGSHYSPERQGYFISVRIVNSAEEPIIKIRFLTSGFGWGEIYDAQGNDITPGLALSQPLEYRHSLEITIFVPSDIIDSGKVLVVEAETSSGRRVSSSIQVP